jgi:WD40 repeat protein
VTVDGGARSIYGLDVSPDGRLLATSGESERVDIRDATTLQVVRMISTSTASVRTAVFSPDHKLLVTVTERDPVVRLWDATTGAAVARLNGHITAPNSVAFHPSGSLLATGSPDTSVLLWQLDPQAAVRRICATLHTASQAAAAPRPDGCPI